MSTIETAESWIPINWKIAKNPYNWFIVVLMVLIAAIGIKVAMDGFVEAREKPPTNSS